MSAPPPVTISLQTGSSGSTTTNLQFTNFTADHARLLMDLVNFARTNLTDSTPRTITNNDINSEFVGCTLTRSGNMCTLTAPPTATPTATATALLFDLSAPTGGGGGGANYLMENMFSDDSNGGYTRVELHKSLSTWAANHWFKKVGFSSNSGTNSGTLIVLNDVFFDKISNEVEANDILYEYYNFCKQAISTIVLPIYTISSPSSVNVDTFKNVLNGSGVVSDVVTSNITLTEFISDEFASALYKKLSDKIIAPVVAAGNANRMNAAGGGPSSSSSQVVAPSLYTDSFYPSKRRKRKGSRTRKKYSL